MPTSVLDDSLQSIRKRIAQLEPLVAEHEQLTAALAALEPLKAQANGSALRPAAAAATTPKAKKSGKAKGRTIAPKGERARQMLQVIGENPGVSAKEVAELMQITIGNAQFQVRKLLDEGQLRRSRGVLYVTKKAEAGSSAKPKAKAKPKARPKTAKRKPAAAEAKATASQSQPDTSSKPSPAST